MIGPLNRIAGCVCIPVVCQRSGKFFRWHDGKDWVEGDELPAAVAASLPGVEMQRCDHHYWRRIGDRNASKNIYRENRIGE